MKPSSGTVEYEAMLRDHAELAYQVQHAQSRKERCDALQAFYRGIWPAVKETPRHEWAVDPYAVDWVSLFTPIEAAFWGDIRSEGAVLYPQHPVGGYFVDFGHPVARIAIECDGKRWHADKEKDKRRQEEIEAKGWTVYRITGRQCFSQMREEYDDEGQEIHELGDAAVFLREICRRHRISPRYSREAA